MSTPVPGRVHAATQETQQQLDELEALISRMLTLPEEAVPEDAPPAPAAAADLEVAKAVQVMDPKPGGAKRPPTRSTPKNAAFYGPPKIVVTSPANEVMPTVVPIPSSAVAVVEPVSFPTGMMPTWIRLLRQGNRAFDRSTTHFGTTGFWLRSNRGRAYLGGLGFGFMAAALTWAVLDWIAWIW